MQKNTVFSVLNALNCNEHVEKKGNLSYLSRAWAWQMLKSHFPDASYTIYENPDGWNYFTDGKTCWVKTGVTIQGLEHIEYLPIMDQRLKTCPIGSPSCAATWSAARLFSSTSSGMWLKGVPGSLQQAHGAGIQDVILYRGSDMGVYRLSSTRTGGAKGMNVALVVVLGDKARVEEPLL